ncbi:MAG TPA: efflux RND transporter permease subunit [Bacteroidales bacterium]|nr:efflux RND transporter permease subunit [Bacteroidales bacterium]
MTYKKEGFIGAAMRNHTIVILITVLLIIGGIFALKDMPRNEFPVFTIRQGLVVGIYPGATSAEVEAQLTTEVENYIYGFKEVNKFKTYSYSKEGMMYMFVELNDDVENADQFWSKLKHGLNDFKKTLPSGVYALMVNSDFGDTSALLITLSSDTKSYKELEKELKKLEAECRKIPATSKIKHFGLQHEKIFVNVNPELLKEYRINSLTLMGNYRMNGGVNYAGELKDGNYDLAVHLPPNYESEKDLANQIVYSDPSGNIIRLKDVATIERRYDEPKSYLRQNGKKTILLSLEMQTGNNIVQYGKDVDKAIASFQKNSFEDIEVAKISELPKYVDESISNFMLEFLMAIIAVILVTIILLPFRVASVAGITVPISVLITLGILYFIGVELHTVSLAGLILVLGMIVDNSIVIIDNHIEKLDHNISPWQAAIQSAKELLIPVVTATLAIMAANIPLGFMIPGGAGEFMKTLPIVISVALIVSVLVAVLLVPYLNFVFIKKGLTSTKKKKGKSFLDRLQGWFDSSLEAAFKRPKWVVGIGALFVGFAVFLFMNLDQQLFPEMERNQFAVEIILPIGASLENTAQVVDSLEQVLLSDNRVVNVASFIGTTSPRFHTMYAPGMPAPNVGQLLINTVSNKATREIVNDYEEKYSHAFANAHVKWKILSLQPTKAPVEVLISSDSIGDIRAVERQVLEIIATAKNVGWVRDDWQEKRQSVKVNLDRDRANRLGYSKQQVANSLAMGLKGMTLTTLWEGDYPVDVELLQETSGARNLNTLSDQYISSQTGMATLPLRSIASFTPEWTEGNIVRRNGIRTLTILVDNARGVVASSIFNEIQPQIDALELPEGTTITHGGDHAEMSRTFIPMGYALGLSIILIFIIILFQFKKIRLSLIIMATMLLALPGTAIGMHLMGYPFGTTAFIGIISLCGMVVRNGIILIDYARELKDKRNMPIYEAALAAGKRRMRPIFLTSAAASAGVVPMILSRSPLWGPVGTVICFGLLISMVLTLYILPVLYMLTYPEGKKVKNGFWSVPPKPVLIALVIGFSLFSLNGNAQTLSLDSCKQLAIENNRKIADAQYNVLASQEVSKAAFTNYFPKISANLMAMRSVDYLLSIETPEIRLPVSDIEGTLLENGQQFAYLPPMEISMIDKVNLAGLTAIIPVYMGGQIRNGNKLAKVGVEVSQLQKEMTTTDVLIKTEELYWSVIGLKEKLNTLGGYVSLLDTLLRDVNNFYEAGLTQRNDVLKVQLRQNELQMNRLKLVNGLDLSKKLLCQHIGIECDSLLTLTDEPNISEGTAGSANVSELLYSRTEYQLTDIAIKAEKLQMKMTRGESLPQLALGGSVFYAEIDKLDLDNTIGLASLSIPITDWWGASHKIKEHRFKIEQARNKQSEAYELLTLQFENARNVLQQNLDEVKLALAALGQAQENLKITQDNYQAGIIGISDLLEAQAMAQSTKDKLTNSKCNAEIAKAKYLQAIGKYEN